MSQELFVGEDNNSLALELLARYLEAADKTQVQVLKIKNNTGQALNLPKLPFLVSNDSKIKSDFHEIAQFVTFVSGKLDLLYGRQEEQKAKVHQFLSDFSKLQETHKQIEFLNNHLTLNTFCTGFHITVADLLAFGQIVRDFAKLDDSLKKTNCNVLRWIDHIQNLVGIKEQVKNLNLKIFLPYEPLLLDQAPASTNISTTNTTKTTNQNTKDNKPKENKDNKDTKDNISTENKKEEKPKKEAKEPKAAAKKEDDAAPISKIDIRVGKIISIVENTNSEKLYNEEIDIGNGEIRKIASGLKGKIPIEDLKDSLVLVLCNLKSRTLCDWPSHGMLLCASDVSGKIEPLRPAAGSKPGDVVTFGNYPRAPLSELPSKKSPWDLVKTELTINEDKEATFEKTSVWTTSSGPVTVKQLTHAQIS